jgi:hypothetical protein
MFVIYLMKAPAGVEIRGWIQTSGLPGWINEKSDVHEIGHSQTFHKGFNRRYVSCIDILGKFADR